MKIAYVRTGGGGGGGPDQCVCTAYRGGEGGRGGSKLGKFLCTYFMDGPLRITIE